MYTKKSKVILIGKEAYRYLQNRERVERGFKPLTDDRFEGLWHRCQRHLINGMMKIDDGYFGGGDGTPNGKWWGWSVDQVAKMLKENGFDYTPAEDRESICIGLGDFQ